jgi:acyl carrier protein
MPTLDHLKEILTKVVRYNGDELGLDTELKDLEADSLHWLQIIVGVETAYNIEIDIEMMKELVTVGDFVKYIDSCAK